MKKLFIFVLCMMLLTSSVFAYDNSSNSNLKLEDIVVELTELYSGCEEFGIEAAAMKMSFDELIFNKARKTLEIREKLSVIKQRENKTVAGTLYYADVPVIEQTKIYNCGPTSTLQVLYALGDEIGVEGDTDAKKITKLETDMKCNSESGTLVGNLVAGLNTYSSDYTYSHYNIGTNLTTKTQMKDKMSNSLTFDVAPILSAMTGVLPYYAPEDDFGHYIAVSSINTSTNKVVLKDCNYMEGYGGTFEVTVDNVYNCLTSGGARNLICLTQ